MIIGILFFSFVITGFITIMLMVVSVPISDFNCKLENILNNLASIFTGIMIFLAFLIFILGCFQWN